MVFSEKMVGLFTIPILLSCLSFWLQIESSYGVTMFAPINAIGLNGNITFTQESVESETKIDIYVTSVKPDTTSFTWKILSLPHYFDSRCSEDNLGEIVSDMSKFGSIQVSSDTIGVQSFTVTDLPLSGANTIWLSSIIFKSSGATGCSNILLEGKVLTATAQFLRTALSGHIVLRQNAQGETIILSQLAYTGADFKTNSLHEWKLLVTDILDPNEDAETRCQYLKTIYDSRWDTHEKNDSLCSQSDHLHCKGGDFTKKHGKITVYNDSGRRSKQKFIDTHLNIGQFPTTRRPYIVIYEKNNPSHPLTCAMINFLDPKTVKAVFDMDGVKGHIGFSQPFNTDPTVVTFDLKNLKGRGYFTKIHLFPIKPALVSGENVCSVNVTGKIYNPFNVKKVLDPNQGTTDQYPVGDLSSKFGPLINQDVNGAFFSVHVDLNAPLFGRHSIIGRSAVIYKPGGEPWICATIRYQFETTTAVATFTSPIAGQIIFRQPANVQYAETTVFVDLSYSDENFAETDNHPWHVHVKPPGADWRNWTDRCLSTGGHFNPTQVGLGGKYSTTCNPNNPYRCELGDLTGKSGKTISIAAHKGTRDVKLFYTDTTLSLNGIHSILGRSAVVHDGNTGQRGNRLACAPIKKVHPLEASTKYWKYSDQQNTISGSIRFVQNNEWDGTQVSIHLSKLNKLAGGFHVHEVSVPIDREFPCAVNSNLGHYDPLAVGTNVTHYPGVGSSDQYEIGDLSGKVGTLNDLSKFSHTYTDHNLPLFGTHSIIGRSVTIHKAENNLYWACGTIEGEIKMKEDGRKIIAIASFDDPRHLISGYIRFTQFEYKDSSLSETWIEVDLKHSGTFNRNVTSGHRWEIFVNQVGADAFQLTESVRCVAGGYRWTPQFQNNVHPLYGQYCSPTNQLRCQLGDLSGRNGHLTIGDKRRLFTDSNLPLTGPHSVVGRSIVIFRKNGSETKMACANIILDIHTKSVVSIKSTPNFNVDNFMNKMREQLRTTKWLVFPDISTYSKILDDECVSLNIHFHGKSAFKLQSTFTNLLTAGTIHNTDEQGHTYQATIPYKKCHSFDETEGSLYSSATLMSGRFLSSLTMITIMAAGSAIVSNILQIKF